MFFALLKFSLWLQNCNWWLKVLSIKSFIKRVILLPGFLQIKSFLFLSFIMVESKCLVKSFKWKFQTLCYCCNFHNYFHFFPLYSWWKGYSVCLHPPPPPPSTNFPPPPPPPFLGFLVRSIPPTPFKKGEFELCLSDFFPLTLENQKTM